MQIKTVLEFSAASLTAFLVACFSPTHQEGLACSEEGLCPSGLACSADQICRSPDTVADGGSLDDAPTAPDAGLSDGGNVPCEFSDTSICASGPIQPAIAISGDPDELNTDTDDRCREFTTAAGSNVCLIYTDSFEVLSGGVLRVVGSKPLFIASVGSIEIHGNVDASSSRNGSRGGGSNSSDCLSPIPADSSNSGGGGGAGGSFQGKGGNGGVGNVRGFSTAGAMASEIEGIPDTLRGGCAGTGGGAGADESALSEPGPGGGAIAFLSAQSFTVTDTGSLFANGGGGGRGLEERGGAAGGGSGGMLVMEAPSVVLLGTILAEGGGGGGGANTSQNGFDGRDPTKTSSGVGGRGAQLGDDGEEGDGGEGSTIASRGEHSGVQGIDGEGGRRGGGGGGGGAGFLIIKANSLQIDSSSPGFTLISSGSP